MARDHGWVNVDAMLRTLTIPQLFELKAYYEMEPRSEARLDLHWARSMHLLFNLNVAKKDQRPLEDFFLKFEHRLATSEAKPDEAISEERYRMLANNTAAVAAFKMLAETRMLSN